MKGLKELAQPISTLILALAVFTLAGVQSGLIPSYRGGQQVQVGGYISVDGSIDADTDLCPSRVMNTASICP
jgi:hypothetical protein